MHEFNVLLLHVVNITLCMFVLISVFAAQAASLQLELKLVGQRRPNLMSLMSSKQYSRTRTLSVTLGYSLCALRGALNPLSL